MCKTITGEVNGLRKAIEFEQMTAAQAARKMLSLYGIHDERDLEVERKKLDFVEPLADSLESHFNDHKQRIVIRSGWTLEDFNGLAGWLAAPANERPTAKAPQPAPTKKLSHRGNLTRGCFAHS